MATGTLQEPTAAIELAGLRHRFGARLALDGIGVSVESGDLYGFLGLNGAGKTTTIRLLLGLLRRQAGEIRIFGRTIAGHPLDLYRQVGFLLEQNQPYGYLSGRENLRQRARILGLERRAARSRIDDLLSRLHLREAADLAARKYSMGMRRRLGLATALLGSPRLLILDEPANGLDPQGLEDLRHALIEETRRGVAVFLSSHLLGEVELLCRRVGLIHQGRMLHEGAVEDITRPARPRMRLRVRPLAAAQRALAAAPWCGRVEVEAEPAEAGAWAELAVEVASESIERLAPQLVATGVAIAELRAETRSLEDFFHERIHAAEPPQAAKEAG